MSYCYLYIQKTGKFEKFIHNDTFVLRANESSFVYSNALNGGGKQGADKNKH